MKISPKTVITRNSQLITKKMKNEYVILDPNEGKFYRLNDTAEKIWKLSAKPRSIEEIISDFLKDFSITKEKAEKEILLFVSMHNNTLFFVIKNS